MKAPTRLFLLRHAEVEADYQRVFGGRINMGLSPRGHEQAATLAKFLQSRQFDAIYSSPMLRVEQTLAPMLIGRNAPVVMQGLREVDFGDWTGLRWEEIHAKFNISAFDWLLELERDGIPNAENGKTFRARVEPCLEEILRAHPGQAVAIACHGGTIRMILSILLDLPLSKMSAFEIDYASLTEVHHAPNRTEIQLLNYTPWRHVE